MAPADFLDLAAKLGQPALAPAIHAVLAGDRPARPVVVDLDPTTFCDLDCPGCISADVLRSTRFGSDRLVTLAGEIAAAGVLAVVLIGGGEPLLHPATGRVIDVLTDAGVAVGLVTNGTRLSAYPGAQLRKLSWIRVSVDAGNAEGFRRARPARGSRDVFGIVLDGIGHAVESGARVGYSFVAMRLHTADGWWTNFPEIGNAARLSRGLGCAYFELKAEMTPTHHLALLDNAELEELAGELAGARRLARPGFAVVVGSGLRTLLDGQAAQGQRKTYGSCPVARLRTLITPSGGYICSYHRGQSEYRIGDLSTQTFEQFWRAADLDIADPRVSCPFHCARHEINALLATGQNPIASTERRTQPPDVFI